MTTGRLGLRRHAAAVAAEGGPVELVEFDERHPVSRVVRPTD